MAKVKLGGITPQSQTVVRAKFALGLITQMLPPHVIIDKLCDKFGVNKRSAGRYVSMARAELAATPPVDLEERRQQMRAAFGVAYVECMAKGSHGPAVRALRELALLDGLYPDQGVRSSFGRGADADGQDVASTEPERVRQRMAELLTKHANAISAMRKPGEN